MERIARIMEIFWLVLACASAVWVGVLVQVHGWAATQIYAWFPLVCMAMFLYRRFTRRKMAAWAARQASREVEERQKPGN